MPSNEPPRTPSAHRATESPYPQAWAEQADLRVFRATAEEWPKLLQWRSDMGRRGWRLLRVSSDGEQMTVVFGRSRRSGRAATEERR